MKDQCMQSATSCAVNFMQSGLHAGQAYSGNICEIETYIHKIFQKSQFKSIAIQFENRT